MNIIKLDTTKMSWNRVEMGATNFKLLGLQISISDDNYFNNVFVPILKNLVNVDFKFVLIGNGTNKYTWIMNPVKIVGFDIVNQEFRENPTRSNISIECLIREQQSAINENINQYQLYIMYK